MINFELLGHLGHLKLWTPNTLFSGPSGRGVNLFKGAGSMPNYKRTFGLHFYVNANLYENTPEYLEIKKNLFEVLHQALNFDHKSPTDEEYPIALLENCDLEGYKINAPFLKELTDSGLNCLILGDANRFGIEYLKLNSATLLYTIHQRYELPNEMLETFASHYAATLHIRG